MDADYYDYEVEAAYMPSDESDKKGENKMYSNYGGILANAIGSVLNLPVHNWHEKGVQYTSDHSDPSDREPFTGPTPRIDLNPGSGSDIVGQSESASFSDNALFQLVCERLEIQPVKGRYDIAPDTSQYSLWVEVHV